MLYQKPFHMTLCANTQICSPIWQRQADGNWNNWFPNLVMIPFHPDFIVDQRYTKIRKTQGPQSWSTLTAINSCACFSSKHIHGQTKTVFKSLYIKQQLMFASAAFIIGCINFFSPTFTIQIQRLINGQKMSHIVTIFTSLGQLPIIGFLFCHIWLQLSQNYIINSEIASSACHELVKELRWTPRVITNR